MMYRFRLWVKLNQHQTADVYVYADNDLQAKMIGESQYGSGNVLNYSRVD